MIAISCSKENKQENQKEIMILFHPDPDTLPRKYQTHVNGYEKSESPDVIYLEQEQVKKIRKLIESGYLTFKKGD